MLGSDTVQQVRVNKEEAFRSGSNYLEPVGYTCGSTETGSDETSGVANETSLMWQVRGHLAH